jgi:hypothetical protein
MRVTTGTVVNGKIEIPGESFAEGTTVTILAREDREASSSGLRRKPSFSKRSKRRTGESSSPETSCSGSFAEFDPTATTTMTSSQIKQRILERLNELSEGEQRKVLEFAQHLPLTPRGTPGKDLLKFFGTIDPEDCRRIEVAIEGGCERTDHPHDE